MRLQRKAATFSTTHWRSWRICTQLTRRQNKTPSRQAGRDPHLPATSLVAVAGALAFVAGDNAVFDVDNAVRILGDVAFVRD